MSHEECDCPNCVQQADNPLAWVVFNPTEQSVRVAIHAVPNHDIGGHALNDEANCACNPWIDDEAEGLVIVHRSYDGREDFERKLRKPS